MTARDAYVTGRVNTAYSHINWWIQQGVALEGAASTGLSVIGQVSMARRWLADSIAGVVNCFVSGTPVDTEFGSSPIETIRLGDRVGPESDICENFGTEGWSAIELEVTVEDPLIGPEPAELSVLRPNAFLSALGAGEGSLIQIDLDEFKLRGLALVKHIQPAQEITKGRRCPVTAIISSDSSQLVRVEIDSGAEISATSGHPFYSVDRRDWVAADHLIPGETLRTHSGLAHVLAVNDLRDRRARVYNLEVLDWHSYFAGADAVYVHNASVIANPVQAYEVSTADDLWKRSSPRDGLAVHHAGQGHAMELQVPGYDTATGPAITVPEGMHRRIPNLRGAVTISPRDILARDIRNLRKFTDAPTSALQKLIALNKSMFPGAF